MKKLLLITFLFLGLCSFSGTIIVGNTNDAGVGSLRGAVSIANAGDTIRFSPSLIAGGSDSIVLTLPIHSDKSLSIIGVYNSSDTLFISGNTVTGIFEFVNDTFGISCHLDSVVLINGNSIPSITGAHGGSIYMYSQFNTCRLHISNSVIKGSNSYTGGALYIASKDSMLQVELFNSLFFNNNGGNGGAAFIFSQRNKVRLNVEKCTFSNNSSNFSGGSLYINGGSNSIYSFNNCLFKKNKSTFKLGGAIYAQGGANSNLVTDSSSFIFNEAPHTNNGKGGAIYSNLNILTKNTIYDSNISGAYGGAIFAENRFDTIHVVVNNSSLTNNSSQYGGAISSRSETSSFPCVSLTEINESTLKSNFALKQGGGIYSTSHYFSISKKLNYTYSIVNVTNSIISDNEANSAGGGIYSYSNSHSSEVKVINSTFEYNKGIAIFSHALCDTGVNNSKSKIVVVKSTFNENSSGLAGALYSRASMYLGYPLVVNKVESIIEIDNSTFTKNSTINHGGAIYSRGGPTALKDTAISIIKAINSTFTDNNGNTFYSFCDTGYASSINNDIILKGNILATDSLLGFFNNYESKVNSLGFNLFSLGSVIGSALSDSFNVTDASLNLGSLSFSNGGTTSTRMPLFPSVAINNGEPTDITDAQNRPVKSIRERGACEYNCQVIMFDTVYSCSSYFWKNKTLLVSGNFFYNKIDTSNSACDSLFNINFNLVPNNSEVTTCYSYKWYGKNYDSSGIYYQSRLPRVITCNIMDTLNLIISKTTHDTVNISACNATVQSYSGKYVYNTSGQYLDTIQNLAGCDSIIQINLNFVPQKYDTVSLSSCNPIPSPISSKTFSITGRYFDTTAKNSFGCDTIFVFNCTINKKVDSINIFECNLYFNPFDSVTHLSSITLYDTFVSAQGCDSVVITNLIIVIDTTIIFINNNLISNLWQASYQWLDCTYGLIPIPGETHKTLNNPSQGSYAVEITKNGCIDTSACYTINSVGINENNLLNYLTIIPNPTNGTFTLDLGEQISLNRIFITDINGRLIKEITPQKTLNYEINFDGAPGIYLLNVIGENERTTLKIIKE